MDFQDLLDEVEEVMQDRTASKKVSLSSVTLTTSSSNASLNGGTAARRKSMDIDDLLSMIDGNDDSTSAGAVHPRSTASAVPTKTAPQEYHLTSGSKKCSTLMLGGESAKRGANTAFATHSVCANLRCNDCDFTVVQFLGKKWSASADYMFFRENVPNETKLRARMELAPGSAAYACQCKWLSIDVQTRVDMCRVKWSCAGH